MNFTHPPKKAIILAIFFSGHVFAQEGTSPLGKDREATLLRAIDVAQNIYSDTQKNALYTVAITRNCSRFYPQLKEKITAELLSEGSGLDQKTREKIKELETSEDPYVKGQIDGASIVMYDKDVMESSCKVLAGMTP